MRVRTTTTCLKILEDAACAADGTGPSPWQAEAGAHAHLAAGPPASLLLRARWRSNKLCARAASRMRARPTTTRCLARTTRAQPTGPARSTAKLARKHISPQTADPPLPLNLTYKPNLAAGSSPNNFLAAPAPPPSLGRSHRLGLLWWSVWNACLRTSRGMWCL